jgi:hypothetical protein
MPEPAIDPENVSFERSIRPLIGMLVAQEARRTIEKDGEGFSH